MARVAKKFYLRASNVSTLSYSFWNLVTYLMNSKSWSVILAAEATLAVAARAKDFILLYSIILINNTRYLKKTLRMKLFLNF